MDYIEVSGKSVDEALTNALVKLQTTSDKVEYEVVEKGSSGILGIFNTKPAVIRVKKKEEVEKDPFFEFTHLDNLKIEEPSVTKVSKLLDAQKEESKKVESEKKLSEQEEEKPTSEKKPVLSHEEIEKRITVFLTDMFQAMDMEVKIKVSFDDKEECVNVSLFGDNMGVLIGKRGQTLDSIQYLTSLVVNKGKDKYVRIKMDTENYRNRRKETLESLAKNIAYKVKRSRSSVSLEPMNPYERRIIHAALQNDKLVSTRSEGEEPFRHVVVFLDKEKAAMGTKHNK